MPQNPWLHAAAWLQHELRSCRKWKLSIVHKSRRIVIYFLNNFCVVYLQIRQPPRKSFFGGPNKQMTVRDLSWSFSTTIGCTTWHHRCRVTSNISPFGYLAYSYTCNQSDTQASHSKATKRDPPFHKRRKSYFTIITKLPVLYNKIICRHCAYFLFI